MIGMRFRDGIKIFLIATLVDKYNKNQKIKKEKKLWFFNCHQLFYCLITVEVTK